MTIDGSVWVGTTKGQILHFTQGQVNPFVPQGVDPALGNEIHVYTTDDTKNVYLLDADNSRVVVLDKNGVYLAQYRWTGGRPRDFVVSEENKKILLLIDGKIYSVGLQ